MNKATINVLTVCQGIKNMFNYNRMRTYITILILACVSTTVLHAQQDVYSLKDCIEKGLENNYSIRIIRNEQQISDNNVTLGNAGYLPTLDLNGGLTGTNNNDKYKLSEGGTSKSNGVNNETLNVGLNASWTVFDGFGIQASYQRLKELQRMGELNTRMTIEDFVASVSSEYYNLIRQKTRLKNLLSSLALSKERVRIAEEQYYIGSGSRLDLRMAQVDFNADSSQVVNQLLEVHSSRVKLNELMAFQDVETTLQVADTAITPNPFLDEMDIRIKTKENNTELLIARKSQVLSELDLKKLKSRNYPTVTLQGGYGYTQNWYDRGQYDWQQRLGFNYGLTIGFSLFDGLNRKREQRNARIDIQNMELMTSQLELSVQATLSNLWMSYMNNLDLWGLEKSNVLVANENYSIALDRYKLGDLAGIQLREAQVSLLEAEERRSIAEYSTKINEISLLLISGQIMEFPFLTIEASE